MAWWRFEIRNVLQIYSNVISWRDDLLIITSKNEEKFVYRDVQYAALLL